MKPETIETTNARPSVGCDALVRLCVSSHTPEELALGWLRYEAVRKMNPRQFGEMCKRNLGGELFDDLVTEVVLGFKPRTDGDGECMSCGGNVENFRCQKCGYLGKPNSDYPHQVST